MHRYFKYLAVATWPIAFLLFFAAAFEPEPFLRYNTYAFGVLTALLAVTFTVVSVLDSALRRVLTEVVEDLVPEQLAKSRVAFATALSEELAEQLADELEHRDEVGVVRMLP